MNSRFRSARSPRRYQRGAALIVALVLLTVLALLGGVTAAQMGSGQKAVNNFQFREEAMSAALTAIEQVISSDFTSSPDSDQIDVDVNNDDKTDITVAIDKPVCIESTTAAGTSTGTSVCSVGICDAVSGQKQTLWEITATATDSLTGAKVKVVQGVRVLLGDATASTVCP
jgi:Tfp pilus assembly protein PilX